MLTDKKVRIAVMVSGGGTNLQALIDSCESGVISCGEIVLVLSSRADAFALKRAESAGISAVAVDRKSCANQMEFESRLLAELKKSKAELIVLAGFMSILSPDFISRYRDRIINIHPSLIPAFCGEGYYGLRVHSAAIERGVRLSGATVHFVNEIPDGGRIILQKAVEVLPDDTAQTLAYRVLREAERVILPQATQSVCRDILANQDSDRSAQS